MEENSLIAALRKAEAEKYAAVPAEDEIEHTFSERFRQRMDRLIRLQRQSVWSMVKTPARRSLLLLMILLLVFGVPPEKNPLFRLAQPIPELSTVAPMEPPVSLRPEVSAGFSGEPALPDVTAAAQTEPLKKTAAAQAGQTGREAWEPEIPLGHTAPAPPAEPAAPEPAPVYTYSYTYVPETYYEPQAEWQDSEWEDTADDDYDARVEAAIAKMHEDIEERAAALREYFEEYNKAHSYDYSPFDPPQNFTLPNGLPDNILF